ncbi:VanZ family protein [Saccharibacillus sp. CPCC 101409]|uniref:VanZ family protein n=1 Tax=Saccharibacillus sp. CPCC 101409 TaxID=3058041 RepID=UPI0026710D7A|nr:VanZ family protein [Saccharibacillus sp. CPCC 101409]MDO3410428.1 VanZ family protein [Saccharibacillus sp. CPCC 101409]
MSKQRKIVFTAFLLYTASILYLMFFGFGRTDAAAQTNGYTFIWMPDSFFKMPALSELLHPTLMAIVDIGNVAAFIPFGLLVPVLYRMPFVRFIGLFVLCVLTIETLQALTLLGSFDVNDVIQNSSGAAIGYGAYAVGTRGKTVPKRTIFTGLCASLLLAGTLIVYSGIDKAFTEEQGPFTALNEWKDARGNPVQSAGPCIFTLGGQKVEPRYNVYGAEHGKKTVYTYELKGKELFLFLNYGIPDQGVLRGSLSISVDGQQILSDSEEYQDREPAEFKWFFEQADELTITIEGREKIWDIGYREMKYFWE